MKRKYHIYTDASVKENYYTISAVIVRNSHIVTVLYKKINECVTSTKAEHESAMNARIYVRETYGISKNDYIIYTDCQPLANIFKDCIWVKGHVNYRNATWKHKYNCLADYIAKYGINDWQKWWYNHKL